LKQRHVSFTRTAQRHVAQEKAWWLENRDYPEVFVEELEQALKVVAVLPGAGTLYARSPIPGVRRAATETSAYVGLSSRLDRARTVSLAWRPSAACPNAQPRR
jgi:hypothetical protein